MPVQAQNGGRSIAPSYSQPWRYKEVSGQAYSPATLHAPPPRRKDTRLSGLPGWAQKILPQWGLNPQAQTVYSVYKYTYLTYK